MSLDLDTDSVYEVRIIDKVRYTRYVYSVYEVRYKCKKSVIINVYSKRYEQHKKCYNPL